MYALEHQVEPAIWWNIFLSMADKSLWGFGYRGRWYVLGTQHGSAIALCKYRTRQEIRRATMHSTHKAFERYFRTESTNLRYIYKYNSQITTLHDLIYPCHNRCGLSVSINIISAIFIEMVDPYILRPPYLFSVKFYIWNITVFKMGWCVNAGKDIGCINIWSGNETEGTALVHWPFLLSRHLFNDQPIAKSQEVPEGLS